MLIRWDGSQLILERKSGSLLGKIAANDESADKIRDALLGEWRWQFLTRLRNDDSRGSVKVELRLIPVTVQTNDEGRVTKVLGDRKDIRPTNGNQLLFHDGDHVQIELRNTSGIPVYMTVLDLSSDGSVNPIFPHPEAAGVQENKLPADGKWHRVPLPFIFRMSEPFGPELYKVIATREPADFSPLLHSQTLTARGEEVLLRGLPPEVNPLGQLLLSAATGKRGAKLAGVVPSTWGTVDVPFEVRGK